MKIYFVGDTRSPFIKQDLELLHDNHQVRLFDLASHATSFWQVPKYLFDVSVEALQVKAADVIWIWFADYPAVPFMLYGKLFRKPVIVNVGGYEVYSAPDIGYGNQIKTLRGFTSRWILWQATQCVVMSQAYRDIINYMVPGAVVTVIPGCIDTSLCDVYTPDKHGIVTAYCDYPLARTIKGIPIFEAATKGIGHAKVIRNMPHDKLIEEFKKAMVYCQLSRTESFGVSLLEAMACGCVPVVSNMDSLPEMIGTSGIVVPYGDINAARQGILKAFDKDGNAARDRASVFTKERRKKKIEEMLLIFERKDG